MEETNYQKYKPAKTIDEQIEYLKTNKRVTFNNISEEDSKESLLKYNYINIISPFKHKFAKLDEKKQVIKDNGNHIYERDVEFEEYYSLFKEEKDSYPIIINNICNFEMHFKSITAHYILINHEINDSTQLSFFLDGLKLKSAFLKEKHNPTRVDHMNRHIDDLKKEIFKYADVYCFFDRMSLGNMLTVFSCLENSLQQKIFNELKKYNMNFNVDNITVFINKVFCLVSIRNCVMHCNSLEILIRFYNPKTHELRKSSDRKGYIKMINYLKNRKNSQ